MNKTIYLEGGGDSKQLKILCRQGFRTLLENSGFKGNMPKLIACGGRQLAFKDFQNDLSHATRNCSNAYKKGKRSFQVLERLSPNKLELYLPSFVRVKRILEQRLLE